MTSPLEIAASACNAGRSCWRAGEASRHPHCWLAVDTISVPLRAVRGLTLTAALHALFWANAAVSLRQWRTAAT
jgi:hypothetical protein